jgi:hypothetical protein
MRGYMNAYGGFAGIVVPGLVALIIILSPLAQAGTSFGGQAIAGKPLDTTCAGSDSVQIHGICVVAGGEQPVFMTSTDQSNYTFGFDLGNLVEMTSEGNVVALSNLLTPLPENVTVQSSPRETNFTIEFEEAVTNATGVWAPNNIVYMGPEEIWPGTATLGDVNVTIVFHLLNVSANNTRVKFDFSASGWPWVSPEDELGLQLFSDAPVGATTQFNESSGTLTDYDNTTGVSFASLAFGSTATASGNGQGQLSVSTYPGIYPPTTPAGEMVSVVMLNFTGVPGGYTTLNYDPWVIFNPGTVLVKTRVTTTPGAPPPTGLDYAILAVVVGGAAAVVLGVVMLRVRKADSRIELETLAQSAS